MYTIHLPSGERDLIIETSLAELENNFSGIRDGIIAEQSLSNESYAVLYIFMAAMNARTIAFRENQRKNWGQVLDVGRQLKEGYEKATSEQRKAMKSVPPLATITDEPAMKLSDVEAIVDAPTQKLLGSHIELLAPKLAALDLCIYETGDPVGFITSDSPCIWYDPEFYKRPPVYQSSGLMHPSIQFWLAISPSHLVFLNRQNITGLRTATEKRLDYLNRVTRFKCCEHFVVNSNYTKDIWFDPGEEPEDSWQKRHERGEV